MTGDKILDEIIAMNLPMLENEEPPISFYADLVEEGLVEVKYNARGYLVVTQGTQFEEKQKQLTSYRPSVSASSVIKAIVIVCGLLSLFTLHRISFGTIPCLCTAEDPCSVPTGYWARIVRRLLGLYGRVVRS